MEYGEEINTTNNQSHSFIISGQLTGPLLAVVIGFVTVVAIFLNLFVILFTLCHPKTLKKSSTIFLTCLAVANLLVSCLFMPFTVITAAAGEWIIGKTEEEKEATCKFVGFMFSYTVGLSVHTLALISFDRFLYIVKPMLYIRYMTPKLAIVIVLGLWIIVGLLSTTPFFGLGSFEFSYSTASCLPLWAGHVHYVIFTFIGSLVPFTTIIVTSVWTFLATRKFIKRRHDDRMFVIITSNTREQERSVYSNSYRNLIGIFGALTLVNVLSFLPYIIVSVAEFFTAAGYDNIPHPIYSTVLVMYLLSNIFNPIVQSYFRQELRGAVSSCLRKAKYHHHNIKNSNDKQGGYDACEEGSFNTTLNADLSEIHTLN